MRTSNTVRLTDSSEWPPWGVGGREAVREEAVQRVLRVPDADHPPAGIRGPAEHEPGPLGRDGARACDVVDDLLRLLRAELRVVDDHSDCHGGSFVSISRSCG
jgi:hypothetical protein